MRTKEYAPDTSFSCALVGEPALVCLETGKPNGHLRHDAGEYRAKALVQS